MTSLQGFREPHPNATLMRALGWLNNGVVLPLVSRVAALHIPADDDARLRVAVRAPFVLCPNHPEFFTDWMIDKWVMHRYAPTSIAWADPEIVNGFGQWFWLSNGLVAAVRGEHLDAALDYSARQVARGTGVLIHPEGEVNWDNEAPGALRTGAVRIASRASDIARRPAQLVPLAWFIRYQENAEPGLQHELDYVTMRLRAPGTTGNAAERLRALFAFLLEREAAPYAIDLGPARDGFAARFERGLVQALEQLTRTWPEYVPATMPTSAADQARAWRSQSRRLRDANPDFKRQVSIIDRMLRLVPAGVHQPTLTQEQIGERIKRLRLDWLRGTLRDDVTRFVPYAAAPRAFFLRVEEPVPVTARDDQDALTRELALRIRRALMQAQQDGIRERGEPRRYDNPFHG